MKDYNDLEDNAYSHGYTFGKYASQSVLDAELLAWLSDDVDALKFYHHHYNIGFNAGLADNPLFILSKQR